MVCVLPAPPPFSPAARPTGSSCSAPGTASTPPSPTAAGRPTDPQSPLSPPLHESGGIGLVVRSLFADFFPARTVWIISQKVVRQTVSCSSGGEKNTHRLPPLSIRKAPPEGDPPNIQALLQDWAALVAGVPGFLVPLVLPLFRRPIPLSFYTVFLSRCRPLWPRPLIVYPEPGWPWMGGWRAPLVQPL